MCEPGQFARRRYACVGLPGTTPAQVCRKQRFVGRVRRQLPPDETRAFAKPFSHHPQGPKRGPVYWQCASLGNVPGDATLARAYQERRLHKPAGNSAFVGRARRHPTKPAHSLNHFITTLRVLDGGIANGSGGDTGRKICGESHHSLAITRASPGYFWSENQFSPK